ncbi:Nicotinate phosphoribosyltransferase 1 [Dichanthelium oligosanthes]|uniref:nicotinate phosphoribosyltransferase n=1 Tax=Dichanthelium oligosanthes TaxID=888268 RepID=A0A1E5VV18_9POAL|nr:Nicotinate phosphoribosyltransferase 1 [Dichanthelium oligosanthes]
MAAANGDARGAGVPRPTNPMVTPLLTDLYQFTMAYAYWKAGKHLDRAVFDLYFRKNPFGGEFTIFGGLEECIRFIANFKFTEEEIKFLRSIMPTCEDGFFEYLSSIDCSDVEVYAIPEGYVVFPKVPLMRIEGPVAVSTRRLGILKIVYEVNVEGAGLDEITDKTLTSSDGSNKCEDFVSLVQNWLIRIQDSSSLRGTFGETSQSELAAFTSYALAFPNSFLALVDTYDVMRSGVPNFCAVALALNDMGYKAVGIRLDSGDLAYLSVETRKFFHAIEKEFGVVGFGKMNITASNDLNEETIDALNKQSHEVDAFGIGTNLVTCYAQPALGCVFKLVEINKQPRIKLSEDVTKVSIPCKKKCYRLYGKEGYPLVDIMTGEDEPSPKIGERLLCRHPFIESKRAYVVPQHVEELLSLIELTFYSEQVSASAKLYDFIHFLWLNEAPVGELQ